MANGMIANKELGASIFWLFLFADYSKNIPVSLNAWECFDLRLDHVPDVSTRQTN